MKKLTTIIALFFAVTAFGQKDSIPPIPDSVMFISKKHIGEAYKRLQERLKTLEDKLVASKYNSLVEGIDAAYQALVDVATEDYRKRKVVK